MVFSLSRVFGRRERTKRPKVIGIGFHKTGTTSLKVALEQLGYTVTGPNETENPNIGREVRQIASRLLQEYDAVQDNPWPLLYKEIDEWYPDAKFILTIRETKDWIRSTVNFFGEKKTPMREWIYGVGSPKGNESIYVERYERHNREVQEYFAGRSADLLVMNFAKGDGWEKLCEFLGQEVPDEPFPHANSASSRTVARKRSIVHRLRRRVRALSSATRPK